MEDASFRKVLQLFSLSWRGFRRVRKGVKKRIARHMQDAGRRDISDYLRYLGENPEMEKTARMLLTVSISCFFRDLLLWETICESVVPGLLRDNDFSPSRPIRAWCAGCSCGEEVYSLKILWDQAGKRFPDMPPIEVWATDTNPAVLERARIGRYSLNSLKNPAPSVLQEYFTRIPNELAVREESKKGIHWLRHDFISELPPQPVFDIIFLRNNLLTYYELPVAAPAFVRILASLRSGGFLIVGNNEKLPGGGFSLQRHPKCRCLFKKEFSPIKWFGKRLRGNCSDLSQRPS